MSGSAPPLPENGRKSTVRTVAWALFGVRGHQPHSDDGQPLSPWKLVLTALAFMIIFVLTLVGVAGLLARP